MLTIENTNKIVNHTITAEWYVEDINEINTHYIQTQETQHLYLIKIRNRTTKYFEHVKLYRVKGIDNRNWYELSCMRGGNRTTKYITKDTIKDIKELIDHIRIVADIN